METLPLLCGDEYIEYDAREFARTTAARLQLYQEREQRLNVAGETLDVLSQNLTPEVNARVFTDTHIVQSRRAGVFPFGNNDGNNDNDKDRRTVRRAPVNALSPTIN